MISKLTPSVEEEMDECSVCGDENCDDCGYFEEAWRNSQDHWSAISQSVANGYSKTFAVEDTAGRPSGIPEDGSDGEDSGDWEIERAGIWNNLKVDELEMQPNRRQRDIDWCPEYDEQAYENWDKDFDDHGWIEVRH